MFVISKILSFLAQPLAWILGLLVVGLLLRQHRPRVAHRLVGVATALLLLTGWEPLPDFFIRHLEGQYAEVPPQADLRSYVGVVVLGGATEKGRTQQAHLQPLFNDAAERMTAPVIMLRHNPHLRLLYTGGEGALLGSGPPEAERSRIFFTSMGLSGPQVQYESGSRTTYENAVLTARMPGVDITQRWLLVTSAWHMPRSMATFVKAGWNVTAYPVDFRTGTSTTWTDYSLAGGANRWDLVLHELLGWLAYRLSGRL